MAEPRHKLEGYMEFQKCTMDAFSVIGKEGASQEGEGFVQKLWQDTNSHFDEIAHLAKRSEEGLAGFWGLMTGPKREFEPWEDNFTKGLYLAGGETEDNALPPQGWTKWTIPAFTYIYCKVGDDYMAAFSGGLAYLEENGLELAGAVQDYTCPQEQQAYLFFPVRRL